MGYTTDFSGQFDFDKPLDDKTYEVLCGLASTRRVWRVFKKEEGYGVDGEFYYEQDGYRMDRVIDDNVTPRTQPSLWLQWKPSEDRLHLLWDGGEKFYFYVEWLLFLKEKVIEPAGYKLTGSVDWQGERDDDVGTIDIVDNQIRTTSLHVPQPKIWNLAETLEMDGQTSHGFYDPAIFKKREQVDAFYEGRSEELPEVYMDRFARYR